MAEITECIPCAHAHPKNGCADVACVHNCENWIRKANRLAESYKESEDAPRLHLQVRAWDGSWTAPNVGGIKEGFDTEEQALDLLKVLRTHDREYYIKRDFRVVKVSTEVVSLHPYTEED